MDVANMKSNGAKANIANKKNIGFTNELVKNKNLYLMILPGFIGFIVFHYLPLYGIIIGFKDYDIIMGFFSSPWVGFKHFINFFNDPYFGRIFSNTLILGISTLLWSFWPPILLALLLNEIGNSKIKKIYQTISYLPHFIAMVVIVGMMMELLGAKGIINNLLSLIGIEPIAFFNKPEFFRPLYIASGIWQGIGWGSILYLSAISGIDMELYEASYIDGANRFQRALYVTIPGILPTITILFILNSGSIINVGFEKVYLMQNPSIYETADVIQTYVYRKGIIDRNFSYATAIGLFNNILAFVILFISNRCSNLMKQNSLW